MSAKTKLQMIAMITIVALTSVNCAQKAFTDIGGTEKDKKLATETVFPIDGDGGPGTPGGTIGLTPGGTIGILPTGTLGITPGGTVGVLPGGTLGTTPGGTLGITPGGTVGVLPGGTMGVLPGGTLGVLPIGTVGSNPGNGTIIVLPGGGTVVIQPVVESYIPVLYLCSNWGTQHKGSLAVSQGLEVIVEQYKEDCRNAQVFCRFDGQAMKNWILTKKTISMPMVNQYCPNLGNGKYRIRIIDTTTKQDILNPLWSNKINHNGGRYGGVVATKQGSVWTSTEKHPFILVDANPPKIYDIKCDKSASPLIIHVNSNVKNPEKLILSSQDEGVSYDILGQNSYPAKHTKKKISWHSSHNYVYITLPNAAGQVNGIDELFGDNTMGPDGQLATQGYEALAKWDGKAINGSQQLFKADGVINQADPIYFKLRIWRDTNFDGIAQKSELHTMQSFGIKSIDLDFDDRYDEWDKYGNRTRFKSVVEDFKGNLHLLFDLWFAYKE